MDKPAKSEQNRPTGKIDKGRRLEVFANSHNYLIIQMTLNNRQLHLLQKNADKT